MATQSGRQGSERLYYGLKQFADNDESDIFHAFFGRTGGVSTDIYSSLNCGEGSEDNPEHVAENRARVAEVFGVEPANLLSLYQVHGDTCVSVTEPWTSDSKPEADAMVTDRPGLALGLLTADCAPVLFCGCKADDAPVIGAAHAGWRGALAGILETAVQGMTALGAKPEDIRACIGPCIDKNSYEVDQEFYEQFMSEDDENERFFGAASKERHHMFDLAGYCAFRLYKAGLSRIYIKDLDTYFNEEDFFSHRRATHRQAKDYGRQISAIMIKS